jgi:hypothetical protein
MSEYKVVINNNKFWYLNGKLHRVNESAGEHVNGTKKWYSSSELYRVYGDKLWCRHYKENSPAIEYINDDKRWYRNDALRLPGNIFHL